MVRRVLLVLCLLCRLAGGLVASLSRPGSARLSLKLAAGSQVVFDGSGALTDRDLDSVSRLLSDSFDSPWFPLKLVSRMDFKAQLEDRRVRLVSAGRNHTMLVARSAVDGEVVGFLEMGLLASTTRGVLEAVGPPSANGKIPVIGNLVVSEKCRRQGIALRLMEQAETAARGWSQYRHILVAVDPANTAALDLYRRVGYSEVDRGPQTVVRDLMQRQLDFVFLLKSLSSD